MTIKHRPGTLGLIMAMAWAVLLACAAREAQPTASARLDFQLHYTVTVDPALTELHARLCFVGKPPSKLLSGSEGGLSLLSRVQLERGGKKRPLGENGSALDLSAAQPGDCVTYDLSLSPRGRFTVAEPTADSRVVDSGLYLLRPPRASWPQMTGGTLRFKSDADLRVSVPFRRQQGAVDELFEVDPQAFEFISRTALGKFQTHSFATAGCKADVALIGDLNPEQTGALFDHLRLAVQSTASVLGRFPAPHMQVLVVVVGPGRGTPVRFGQVTRGGGAGVLLLVSSDAKPSALRRDWTAFHEFAHLFLPFISREDAWLSEGVATYYQEVLRVRAGVRSQSQALRRLLDRGLRAAELDVAVAQESVMMMRHGSFSQVYWAGATFAFAADVSLRTLTGNSLSLDALIRLLQDESDYRSPPTNARTLLSRMDALSGSTWLHDNSQAHVQRTPPLSVVGLLTKLDAYDAASRRVRLGSGPGSAVREAIFAPSKAQGRPSAVSSGATDLRAGP